MTLAHTLQSWWTRVFAIPPDAICKFCGERFDQHAIHGGAMGGQYEVCHDDYAAFVWAYPERDIELLRGSDANPSQTGAGCAPD